LKQRGENAMKKTWLNHSNNESMLENKIQITNELSSQPQDQTHNDPPPSFEQQCSKLTHKCLNQSSAS
jgi:hypothetical protein